MKSISLLQWNIWYKEPIDFVISEIQRWNPDIVCIQECITRPGYHSARLLAKALNYSLIYQPAQHWSNNPLKQEQGNAILSRFPIHSSRSVFLQTERQTPKDGSDEGRVYIEVEIQIGATLLTVGTTHLSYSPKFAYTPKRADEAKKLIELIAQKQKKYIFAGDLNSPLDSPIITNLEKYLVNSGPTYDQPTWTTKPFDYHGWQEDQLRWRIDYVFATPDIKVESAKILKTTVSDHLPILVTIEL